MAMEPLSLTTLPLLEATGDCPMRCFRMAVLALLVGGLAFQRPTPAADPFWGADPAWTLLHEPAVWRELELSSEQSRQFHGLLDGLDARFFPLRNKPEAEATKGAGEVLADATRQLQSVLSEAQLRRLAEIQSRQQGTTALLQAGMAKRMNYKPRQREQLETVISETAAATRMLEKRLANGEPREPLEKEYSGLKRDELRKVTGILTGAQRSVWQKALGRDFDLTMLGRAEFKAPELIDSGEWLNSKPLSMRELEGRVVVLHFYAFGCSNCIHNYPTYLDWQERFRDAKVVILGIHTPETSAEQDSASVKRKAEDAGFGFPVLVDRTKANWDAWGNSMWPSVYLIDRRGYLRYFWPGELKWQGATGDRWMQERIEELLAEPSAAGSNAEPAD
jgi:peroxiredoxin